MTEDHAQELWRSLCRLERERQNQRCREWFDHVMKVGVAAALPPPLEGDHGLTFAEYLPYALRRMTERREAAQ